MKKTRLATILVIAVLATAGSAWWLTRRGDPARELVLYGNVDLRQVELAFNNSERIAAVLVEEGNRMRIHTNSRLAPSSVRPG
jgi:membrane fusion protein PltH